MQESKDAAFFNRKQKDMERLAGEEYSKVRRWQVGPTQFEKTEAPDMVDIRKSRKSKKSLE